MILIELFKIFTIALVGLTGLVLMAGLISEAMKEGLSPQQILMAIPLLLPSMLPYTVPTTTLFATCIVYGRLAADNEIVALKAAGVHMIHIIWPALLLGAVASAATLWLSLDFIPYTHFLLKSQVAADVEQGIYTVLRKDGCLKHPKFEYEIYVKTVQGRTLLDAQFMRRSKRGGFDTIIWAREAELFVDLLHQQMLVDMRQCQVTLRNGTVGFMQSRVWPIDLPGDFNGTFPKNRATDMTWDELAHYRDQLEERRQSLSGDIDRHQLSITIGKAPPNFRDHVRTKAVERKVLDSQIFAIDCEYHLRPSFALGCFCFALVGCPVGVWFSKSDYLSAFVTCFIPIVTIYYPVMFLMINMARIGKMPPWMGMYNANVLMWLAGLVLLRRLAKG